MQYHPDKNNGDPYAQAYFNEIKEAYDVLMHPQRKEAWLQQRWLLRAQGKSYHDTVVTAPNILKKSIELQQHIRTTDLHRTQGAGITRLVQQLLNKNTIELLLQQNEKDVHATIIRTLLPALALLSYPDLKQAVVPLQQLANGNAVLLQEIEQQLQKNYRRHRLQRLQAPLVLLLTLLICWLIFSMSR
jgi:predicted nucleic acid-binding Zn ribbon protein